MPPANDYIAPNDSPPAPIHRVLKGQKALVTGASKGLGQAIAIGFAQAGDAAAAAASGRQPDAARNALN